MGLWYEEFEPGRSFQTAVRTVTEGDIRGFAALSGDRNPIHLDAAAARASGFPGPIAHGALGVAVATGLISQADLTQGTLIALLEIRWAFKAPVLAGDALSVRLQVVERQETRSPDRGIVRLEASVVNQDGEVVQEGTLVELLRRRPV